MRIFKRKGKIFELDSEDSAESQKWDPELAEGWPWNSAYTAG